MAFFVLSENSTKLYELLNGPQENFDQCFTVDKSLCIVFKRVDIIASCLSQLIEKIKLNTNLTCLKLRLHDRLNPIDITINVSQEIANILALNKIINLQLYRMVNTININPIIDSLKINTSLQVLNLHCNNISDSGTILLAQTLENHTTLKDLDLNENNISILGTAAIAQMLRKNNTISNLNLCFNDIGEGIEPITEALHHNHSLFELKLAYIKLSMAGIQALGELLKINTCLTELNLTGNDIGDDGVNIIAQGLIHNSSLTTLYLRSVNMGDKSLVNLAQALSHNSSLTNLTLGNSFGDEGIKAIGECLKTNSTLNTMWISGEITKNGLESLYEGLKYNSTLTQFELTSSNTEGAILVREIEARCKLNQFNQTINSKTLRDILLEYKK